MKIICIGRNYAAHAKELNNPIPTEPVIFFKPDTALIENNQPFYYPDFTNDLHHEVEIVLRVCKQGKHIEEKFAHKYYDKITLGIDFTARDLQEKCKQKGLPWERAKAFDGSAPVGTFIEKNSIKNLSNIDFQLLLNGKKVQLGNTADLIFSFDRLISEISKFITLKTGDLIFTGTPEGVGPVLKGDKLEAFISDKKLLEVEIR